MIYLCRLCKHYAIQKVRIAVSPMLAQTITDVQVKAKICTSAASRAANSEFINYYGIAA